MAVAFDAKSTSIIGANAGTSFSDSAKMTVGATANALLVLVGWSTATAPTSVSITWNGVALTLLSGTSLGNTNCNTAIYGMIAPATGTQTLAGSWTGSRDYDVQAVSFTGVDQTSVAVAFPNGNTASGNSTTPSVVITSAINNAIVGLFSNGGIHGWSSTSGTTLNSDALLGNIAVDACYDAGAATVTASAVIVIGATTWTASGIDILAARAPNILSAQIWI